MNRGIKSRSVDRSRFLLSPLSSCLYLYFFPPANYQRDPVGRTVVDHNIPLLLTILETPDHQIKLLPLVVLGTTSFPKSESSKLPNLLSDILAPFHEREDPTDGFCSHPS